MSDSEFLFDSSIWVALAFDAHPAHSTAVQAFARASKRRPACFCRSTQQSFLRLTSTPAILHAYGVSAMTNDDALDLLEGFMASPAVAFREEPPQLTTLWPKIAKRTTASPKLWMDAYLAAFAITGKLAFVSADKAFEAFKPIGLDLVHVQTP